MSVKYIIEHEFCNVTLSFRNIAAMAKCYYTGANEQYDNVALIIRKRIGKVVYDLKAGKWHEAWRYDGQVLPMTKNEKRIMSKISEQTKHFYNKRYLKRKAAGYDFCPY